MTKQPHGEPHGVVPSETMEQHRQLQSGFSQRCGHLSSDLLPDYDSVGAKLGCLQSEHYVVVSHAE